MSPTPNPDFLRTLLLTLALGSLTAGPVPVWSASAQPGPNASRQALVRFDIPSQPLSSALPLFIQQSGVDALIYAHRDLGGAISQELIGEFPLLDALQHLLSATRLQVEVLGEGALVIRPGSGRTAPRPQRGSAPLPAEPAAEVSRSNLIEEIVTIGTRVRGHTSSQASVPVDIVAGDMLQQIGTFGLGERLQSLAPSFNFSRTTVSDGTDFVRPATLRGLSPDQMLVLVNGKRRHSQAQINIQQSVGRGSSGTDINAIPLVAIERVEVLRDGAAAQYGSDAIAGVINIVLKNRSEGTELQASYGQSKAGDGNTADLNVNTGWTIGEGGYFNLSLQSLRRQQSNRAGLDQRFEPPQVSMRIGEAENDFQALFFNGALDVSAGQAYWFGGLSQREGQSAGFYRAAGASPEQPPVSSRYVPVLFPQGFLPLQQVEVDDESLTLGWIMEFSEQWQMDASLSYGRNRFTQGTQRSVNVSLGVDSPTSADNGYLEFQQLSANWDLRGQLKGYLATPLYLAAGVEYREEQYRVRKGEFASYAYGPDDNFDVFIPSPLDPCPNWPDPDACPDGSERNPAQAGMQAFPGFRSNVNADRDSLAFYLDAETDVTDRLRLGGALRLERYEDVGANGTGKLSFRFQGNDRLALRGAISSGFRAPGLNQRAFTNVLTNIGPDLLTDTLHSAEGSAANTALGVQPLQEERSTHLSMGLVWTPKSALNVTLDWYYIDIEDRIVMTDVIAADSVSCILGSQCALDQVLQALNRNVGAVQFFTNAIDTQTQGADLVISGDWDLGIHGLLHLNATAHYNKTEVKNISPPAGIEAKVLFSDAQVDLIETGQPRQRLSLVADWALDQWQVRLMLNRYGKVKTSYFTEPSLGVDVPGAEDEVHKSGAAWLTDVDISYQITPSIRVAIGANNLFDVQPDKLASDSVPSFITGGSFVYPWESTPFGIQGAFYYTRLQGQF